MLMLVQSQGGEMVAAKELPNANLIGEKALAVKEIIRPIYMLKS